MTNEIDSVLAEFLVEEEEITTPGEMAWVPCTHTLSLKCPHCGVCEACRGTGRVLVPVSTERAVLTIDVD